jgi:hypothetical protein
MKKICFINVFFGEFPWYFNLFLKSCETNPTIDFLLFSDSKWNGELPKNVKIILFSLNEFNNLASEKLDFQINIKYAYKLCDFKPAYGLIFSEYLKNYDFWGIIDIDLILGRIREFMTEELLNKFEIISVRDYYPTGSFLLFQNNKKINYLFTKSKDYQKVFTNDKHFCFDECNFAFDELEKGVDIFDIPCEIESMLHVIKREEKLGNLNPFFDFFVIEGMQGKIKWENGILSYNKNFEILDYHLIAYKSHPFTSKKHWKTVPNVFYIDKYYIREQPISTLTGFFQFIYFNYIKILKFKLKFFLKYK